MSIAAIGNKGGHFTELLELDEGLLNIVASIELDSEQVRNWRERQREKSI